MGRIVCRVVACVPPWTVDPSCTTAVAVDNATAEQNEPCWTPAPPMPPCTSAATNCQVVGLAPSGDGCRVRRGHLLRQAVRLRGLPRRRRRLGPRARCPDRRRGPVPHRGLLPGGVPTAASSTTAAPRSSAPWAGRPSNAPVVGMAATPSGQGLLARRRPTAASSTTATRRSSAPWAGRHSTLPVVGMAATPSGQGYWLVAADGGIFAYGDAAVPRLHGRAAPQRPVVGMAATPSGQGYWLVAADGGIFAYGDAVFDGSTGAIHLNRPVVGMAAVRRRRRLLAGGSGRRHLRLRRLRRSSGRRHDGTKKGAPMTALLTLAAAAVAVVAAARSTWSPCGVSMLATITPLAERARGHRYRSHGDLVRGGRASVGGARSASSWRRWPSAVRAAGPSTVVAVAAVACAAALVAAAADARLGRLPPARPPPSGQRALARPVPSLGLRGRVRLADRRRARHLHQDGGGLPDDRPGRADRRPVGRPLVGALFGLVRGLAVLLGRGITTAPSPSPRSTGASPMPGPSCSASWSRPRRRQPCSAAWLLSPWAVVAVVALGALGALVRLRRRRAWPPPRCGPTPCGPTPCGPDESHYARAHRPRHRRIRRTAPTHPPPAGRRGRDAGHPGQGPHRAPPSPRCDACARPASLFAVTSGRPPRGMEMLVEPLAPRHAHRRLQRWPDGGPRHERRSSSTSCPSTSWSRSPTSWRPSSSTCGSTAAPTGTCRDPKGPHVDREAWTVKFAPKVMRRLRRAHRRRGQARRA